MSFPSFSSFSMAPISGKGIEKGKVAKKRKKGRSAGLNEGNQAVAKQFNLINDELEHSKHVKILSALEDLDFFIDPVGDSSNYSNANLNQIVPAYKLPRVGRLFPGAVVKRVRNYWLVEHHDPVPRLDYKLFSKVGDVMKFHWKPDLSDDGDEFISIPNEMDEFHTVDASLGSAGMGSEDFQEKHKQAERLALENPTNVDAWISFIKLQDDLALSLLGASSQALRNVEKRIHNKKMAIVERALEEVPDSDRLLAIVMNLKSLDSDSRQMLGEWDIILRKHPYSFDLCREYLNYRMGNAASFTLEALMEIFEDSLGKQSRLNHPKRDEIVVYLIARLCFFLRQMGYMERALSIFQANIELNSFSPSTMGWRERVGLFEDYWETEKPRFGEKEAQGWCNTKDQDTYTFPDALGTSQFESITDPLSRWLAQEEFSDHTQWLSIRNSIQEDIQDPFQTVVYSDIDSCLFPIHSVSGRQLLLEAFLLFLGFGGGLVVSSTSVFYQDPHLHTELENPIYRNQFLNESRGAKEGISMSFPFHYHPTPIEGLFGDDKIWPSSVSLKDLNLLKESKNGLFDFILRILEQSSELHPSNIIHLLWIQSLSSPKEYVY
jgi:hypothetical protein